jgi:hypothetical protein
MMNANFNLDTLNPSLQTSRQMSKHYVQMDTRNVLDELLALQSGGSPVFQIRDLKHKRSQKSSTLGRGVHLVRVQMTRPYVLNGETLYPELVIKNSYDGSSALEVHMGIFRLVCSNGLVVKTKDLGSIKVRHTGTPFQIVQDMIKGMVSQLPKYIKVQEQLQLTELSGIQIQEFARRAAAIRFNGIAEDAEFESLIETVRPEDAGNSLWQVFNVVQEKLMTGGVKLSGMKRVSRSIKAASEDLRINTELFELAMEYANSTGGHAEVEVLESVLVAN